MCTGRENIRKRCTQVLPRFFLNERTCPQAFSSLLSHCAYFFLITVSIYSISFQFHSRLKIQLHAVGVVPDFEQRTI